MSVYELTSVTTRTVIGQKEQKHMSYCTGKLLLNGIEEIFVSVMADQLDENFPSFNLFPGFDMLSWSENIKSIEKYKEESLNSGTEDAGTSKKRRFADLDSIVENSQAERTKQATQWAVSVFKGRF